MKRKVAESELKFEQALKRLEQIVEEMEAGEVSLDDLLKKYEEGMKLAQFCQAKLGEAQQKIELLAKGKLKPFEKKAEGKSENEDEDDKKEKETETKLF